MLIPRMDYKASFHSDYFQLKTVVCFYVQTVMRSYNNIQFVNKKTDNIRKNRMFDVSEMDTSSTFILFLN